MTEHVGLDGTAAVVVVIFSVEQPAKSSCALGDSERDKNCCTVAATMLSDAADDVANTMMQMQ